MLPHTKALVQRLAGQPFAMLGINSDSAEVFRRHKEKMGVTWRNIHDGGGRGGPVATAWGVWGWPQLYVLDARGKIRFKNVFGAELDRAVDELLAEQRAAEAAKKR
tara:strand:+ start:3158 stop:3475 length:318 start_codon:yes stop_codon:yes gene_type:complete